jgi:hypothetical protein
VFCLGIHPILLDAAYYQFSVVAASKSRFEVALGLGRYPSGQRGQTVNLLPSASKVRILACPPKGSSAED